jgi:Lon protease-like protein
MLAGMDAPKPKPLPELAPALASLPLFPLPQAVLMPGALLPLHVFEPRYRAMVRDALAGHQSIGVVQILEPLTRDDEGQPIIARIAGVGTIVDHVELPSGRFNIVLRGRARVALAELPFVPPYRRALATVLESVGASPTSSDVAALVATATAFVALVRERDDSFEFRLPKLSDPGQLADHCAQHLLVDGRDRQRALDELDVSERVRLVTETIALQQLSLSGASGGELN